MVGGSHAGGRAPLAIGLAGVLLAVLGSPLLPTFGSSPAGLSPPPPSAVPPRSIAGPGPALAAEPTYSWSTAQIYYSPGDPAGLLFGEGAVMAVDDRVQNTVSFGGWAMDGLSDYTLVYDNASNGTWWYAGSPTSPLARANASFASFAPADEAVLFGGLANLSSERTLNDTWAYHFDTETWVNVSSRAAPPARESAAFAIDPADGLGILFGGISPRYAVGNSTGSLLWNDTWLLNLSTFTWTSASIGNGPPAEFGGSLVWDPVADEFLLFGGCSASRCTDGVWTYTPGSARWGHPALGGSPPSARGSAAFVWDPLDNVALLFGGLAPGPDGPVALGGTYLLDVSLGDWSTILSTGGPPPTYGAASAFSDYPGCVGMWVQGGSSAPTGIVYNVSVLEPTSSLIPNCFTPFGGGTGGGPPAACSNVSAHLTVQVRDALTGDGLVGADLDVSGSCGLRHAVSGAGGFVNITEPAPDLLTITASRVGYHSATVSATYTGLPGAVERIDLAPLPTLTVRVFGRTAQGVAPLEGASVTVGGTIVLGTSSADGWVNGSAAGWTGGNVTISASAPGFSVSSVSEPLPYSGVAFANLTLQAFGALAIHVVDNATHLGVPGATINLTFVDPVGANTTVELTDPFGWFNTSLSAGNYSATVAAPGYFSNGTSRPFFHPWIDPTPIEVELARSYGANVAVQVLSAASGRPIANATVSFGGGLSLRSNPAGWANGTNLGPPGLLRISVSAWGYYPNFTTVRVGAYLTLADVPIELTPAPPCSPFADCPAVNGSAPPGLTLLPPPGLTRTVVLSVPLGLAVAGLAALVLPRLRAAGRRPARPAPIEPSAREVGPSPRHGGPA